MRAAWLLMLVLGCRKSTLEVDDLDDDGFSASEDCNDSDPLVFPGADEICDGIDNNCSGAIDDNPVDASVFFPDDDGDGIGIVRGQQTACDAPDGFVTESGDCNDADPTVFPGAPEICDNLDNDCNGVAEDDGTASWYPDADSDGIGAVGIALDACEAPDGYVSVTGDCDDRDASVAPDADEVCDDIDNNCDGQVDEGLTTPFYADGDGDGFGGTVTTQACEAPEGFVAQSGDCNDASNLAYPGGTEVCDTLDNNCDGQVDEGLTSLFYADGDADGFGSDVTTRACELPAGFTTQAGDCDDSEALAFPGNTEVCDFIDNDCNGVIDEDLRTLYYADADGDGVGSAALTLSACSPPQGWVEADGDCNDGNATVFPGATEVCDGLDNNCDSAIDEDLDREWFIDADRDGFGTNEPALIACEAPSDRYTDVSGDCNDLDPSYSPEAPEACDDTDRNCDGMVDNDADGDGLADRACGGSDCDDDDPELPVDGSCADGNTCLEIRDSDPFAESGTYLLDVDQDGPLEPIEVTCDLEQDGGGWTPVFIVDDLGGSGVISGESGGFNRSQFIDLLGTNRFTDATWSYDADTNVIRDETRGMVVGADQGALDIALFEGRWTDVRMTCSTEDRATEWEHRVTVPDYTTLNGNYQLLGAATNGTAYEVDPETNTRGQSTVWHDNELQGLNSNHYLCDLYGQRADGTTQFGFCYTDFLNNPNGSDMGDSIVSIAFGSQGRSDGWTHGFTGECGPMGTRAQQNNGTYVIWIR